MVGAMKVIEFAVALSNTHFQHTFRNVWPTFRLHFEIAAMKMNRRPAKTHLKMAKCLKIQRHLAAPSPTTREPPYSLAARMNRSVSAY
jgi:hypothetical protein